jgi:hypothetical protein
MHVDSTRQPSGWFVRSCSAAIVLLVGVPALGGTIYVNGATGNDAWSGACEAWDGATCGPKRTIQAGIDAAVAGDTVLIADGTYTGTGNKDLNFAGRAITVRSASGDPANCIIDCEGTGRGFYFHNSETAASIVRGVTIRKGHVTGSSPGEGYGAGIYCYRASPTLSNCVITENAAELGAGISCRTSANPTLIDCVITKNTAAAVGEYHSANGAGLHCYDHASPTLINCTITENSATAFAVSGIVYGRGGGVYCYEYCNPTLTNCTIASNSTSSSSGYTNPTSAGAGICLGYHSNAALTDCLITGNRAAPTDSSSGGAGLYCDASDPQLTNCTITDNETGQQWDRRRGRPLLQVLQSNTHTLHCQQEHSGNARGRHILLLLIDQPTNHRLHDQRQPGYAGWRRLL